MVLLTGLGVPALWWHGPGEWTEDVLQLIGRESWGNRPFLAPSLAQDFRVVTYDRAGMEDRPPPEGVRRMDDFIQELDGVLEQAQVKGPLALMGHSLGGLIALEYARRTAPRVAGLVLLDSSHPDQLPRFAAGAGAGQRHADAEEQRQMAEFHPERPDLEHLLSQGEGAVRPGTLGDFPLLVLTRGIRPCPSGGTPAPPMTAKYWQYREQTWQRLQRELTALSNAGQQRCFPDSGHYLHLEEPARVLEDVRAFLRQLQDASPGAEARSRQQPSS
ncbi:Pimeloyl-ACP methyl ester carboxylesterase [Deinococcus hopiensis KR-140]|uniref:Pimeloyl-ACP methyl ester carboxylesterase n=1 Tax=Deinococcus hopiensis KR-140 TaxID=695939 RepID=A0A1W1UQN2_9DEIO|nr:Pimeloyl-ACP methyl ester carboxylesterase [Deinococcus hopiensis KR-140]